MTAHRSRLQRYCQRCQLSSNLRTCAKLCRSCVHKGWRWCSIGKHVVRADTAEPWRKRCNACKCEAERRAWHVDRDNPADPPPGYVPTAVIAKRLHYTNATIVRWLRNGWMRDAAWRREGHRTHWYVEDRSSYEEPIR